MSQIAPLSVFSSLLWGLFCACSWTWCIGMFLPRIMIERFGWPGFLVFAIPNVIGCAAFGYVVKNRKRSEAMVASHATAMTLFSVVTVAYHMFFIVFLLNELLPAFQDIQWLPLGTAAIVLGLGILISGMCDRDWLILTAITYAVSITALFSIGLGPLELIQWQGRDPQSELWWLAPAIAFGFLLCPYLDLTFHRAIQLSPSKHAFAVFGVGFAAMLVLTCAMWFMPLRMLVPVAIVHLMMQIIFTVGAHVREIRISPALTTNANRWLAILLPFVAALLPSLMNALQPNHQHGEATYLRFLVFYGLVFPLYALFFMMLPARDLKRTIGAFIVILAVSIPCFEMAFLHHRPWLLVVPGILIVIVTFLHRRQPAQPLP